MKKAVNTKSQTNRLKRARNPMPDFVRKALQKAGLMASYQNRPAYQRNDYLGWISRAKLEPTRQRRLEQMLDEVRRGDRYMNMVWRAR